MLNLSLADIRLRSQHISQADFTRAADVVSWMGAMQAQDYAGSLWAIALRTPHLTQTDVEQAIADRQIVRTWPMRGTLHFVASEDIRWMLALLTPRILAGSAGRLRQLNLDDTVIEQAEGILQTELSGGKRMTRKDIFALFEHHGISSASQRGAHILGHLSQQGLLCLGTHEGKQPTFTLLEEWLKPAPSYTREEALQKLAMRYFTSHGPASLKDFAGWAHMTIRDAKLAIELAGNELAMETVDGVDYWLSPSSISATHDSAIHLLPGFDEYVLGYKNRDAIMQPDHIQIIVPGGNGMFLSTIVENGRVIGTWKKTIRKNDVQIHLAPFQPLGSQQLDKIEIAAKRYGEFLGLSAAIN